MYLALKYVCVLATRRAAHCFGFISLSDLPTEIQVQRQAIASVQMTTQVLFLPLFIDLVCVILIPYGKENNSLICRRVIEVSICVFVHQCILRAQSLMDSHLKTIYNNIAFS